MLWQDYVIMTVCFGFGLAMIPSILSEHKPSKWTNRLTFLGLLILTGVFATLDLWLSLGTELFASLCWGILTIQTWKNK